HRHCKRSTKPGRGEHTGRHQVDLLGESLLWTVLGAAAPAPFPPLHRHQLPTTGQVPWPGQYPVLARARQHLTARTTRGVRVVGDQLNDLDPEPGEHDTLHRQTLESQQARRIISTVNHGPWLSPRC